MKVKTNEKAAENAELTDTELRGVAGGIKAFGSPPPPSDPLGDLGDSAGQLAGIIRLNPVVVPEVKISKPESWKP